MDTETRICYQCLIREIAEDDYYSENIEKYILALKASDRASDELYEERLSTCKQCDKLLSGTCQACGCYVEIRAAMNIARCPKKKW